ncbi:MAG: BTAD domain-containing putative transcriptional regulator [Trueperaceae bacterium]
MTERAVSAYSEVIMELGVRLLGTPEARAGGAWLPLGPSRPHAVFVYVAARGGFVRRAEVAELLWPGLDDAHAFGNLRQALRRLVNGPLAALLGLDRTGVWLDGDCDVAGFRRAVAERRWRDALVAHQGPLLEGFEVDDADEFSAWLASERAAVAADWRQACRALLAEASAEGRYGEAVGYADQLVRADPLDEQAVREAMQAAAADGDAHGVTRRYREFEVVLRRECGVEPEAATRALFERLAERSVGEVEAPGPHPVEPVRLRYLGDRRGLVGRERALSELVERLRERDSRLITLLGPGGIGKTALASALVAELQTAFPDGAVMVPLEGAEGPEAVALAVAHATGVRVEAHAPVGPQLVRGLRARRLLVVLDGFETHVEQLPSVDALLRGTRDVRLVVTSRVRLGHSAEVVFEVDPLATGSDHAGTGPVEEGAASPAAQLFLRRAAGRLPLATVRGFDLERVERVVEALGGHPLAIELAASWVDVLGLERLTDQLQDSWTPLSSDDVDRSERQRDVRAVIDETWQQLDPEDRAAWARLALMPGSLDPTVAAAVGGSGWRGLRRLVDRSVVRHRGPRLELHALLARYGRERAEEMGQVDGAWGAARAVWRPRIAQQVDPRTGRRVFLLPDDLDQAVAVWRLACAAQDWATVAEMAVGLMRALHHHMRWRQAVELWREAVDRLVAAASGRARDVALARLWPLVGLINLEASANAARALVLADARGDDLARALAHDELAHAAFTAEREAHVRAAREAFERAGDDVGYARMLANQGELAIFAGQWDHGVEFLAEARRRLERLGDLDGLADLLLLLAKRDAHVGDFGAARRRIDQARGLLARGGDPDRIAPIPAVLMAEATLARAAGDREASARALEAYARILSEITGQADPDRLVRAGHHTRFGPPSEALEAAHRLLRDPATTDREAIARMYANVLAAMAHARLGQPELGLDHLRDAVRSARPWGVPRAVARITAPAAVVALARGQAAFAGRLAGLALRYPALEFEARPDVEAVMATLGAEAGPSTEGDDASAAELLDEVEAWLDRSS